MRSPARRALLGLLGLWIAYALSLDVRFERFPDVTWGAIEIALVIGAVAVGGNTLVRRLRRAGRGNPFP